MFALRADGFTRPFEQVVDSAYGKMKIDQSILGAIAPAWPAASTFSEPTPV
jgi:hypothetical protein